MAKIPPNPNANNGNHSAPQRPSGAGSPTPAKPSQPRPLAQTSPAISGNFSTKWKPPPSIVEKFKYIHFDKYCASPRTYRLESTRNLFRNREAAANTGPSVSQSVTSSSNPRSVGPPKPPRLNPLQRQAAAVAAPSVPQQNTARARSLKRPQSTSSTKEQIQAKPKVTTKNTTRALPLTKANKRAETLSPPPPTSMEATKNPVGVGSFCSCRKTQCLNNHCRCFKANVRCGRLCLCVNCGNSQGGVAPGPGRIDEPAQKRAKIT